MSVTDVANMASSLSFKNNGMITSYLILHAKILLNIETLQTFLK
jgi:hypothetical protein